MCEPFSAGALHCSPPLRNTWHRRHGRNERYGRRNKSAFRSRRSRAMSAIPGDRRALRAPTPHGLNYDSKGLIRFHPRNSPSALPPIASNCPRISSNPLFLWLDRPVIGSSVLDFPSSQKLAARRCFTLPFLRLHINGEIGRCPVPSPWTTAALGCVPRCRANPPRAHKAAPRKIAAQPRMKDLNSVRPRKTAMIEPFAT